MHSLFQIPSGASIVKKTLKNNFMKDSKNITFILTGECTLKAATRSHLVSDDTPTSRVANTKLLENEFWGTVHQRYIFTLNPTKLSTNFATFGIQNLSLSVSVSLLALSTLSLGGHRS